MSLPGGARRALALLLPALLLALSAAPAAAAGEKGGGKGKGKKDKGAKSAPKEDVEALVKSGEAAYTAGDLAKAAALFAKVVEKFPSDYRGYYYSGMILAQEGKKDGAEAMYRKAVERKPDSPEALNNLGVILQEKKKFEEAEASFTKAVKADPAYYEGQFNLGFLYEEWGKPDKAVAAYVAAAGIETKDPEPFTAIGEIEAGRGKLDAAVAAYRAALERDPTLLELRITIAGLLRKAGKAKEAIEEAEAVIAAVVIGETGDLALPFKAAREIRLAGKPARTLKVLATFPAKAQKSFSVQTEVGQCHLALGSCKEAAKAFGKALEAKAGDAEATLALGDAHACAKSCGEAVKAWEAFLALAPGDPRAAAVKDKIKSCKGKGKKKGK